MRFSRRSRVISAFIMLLSMLTMQVSMATCKCPAMMQGMGNIQSFQLTEASSTVEKMPCGHTVEHKKKDGACASHMKTEQAIAKVEIPQVPPVVFGILSTAVLNLPPVESVASAIYDTSDLIPPAPSLRISYCSFQL